jgi:chromosome segregation ATPase
MFTQFDNRLDAICIAMALDIKNLRVSSISDLICSHGEHKENVAIVKLILSDGSDHHDDEVTVHIFKDSVSSRKYTLNGKHVTQRSLRVYLQSIGVRLYNHSNPSFIILQNTVTTLLNRNPIEIANMISDASGGLSFYENVKKTMSQIDAFKKSEVDISNKILDKERQIKADLESLERLQEYNGTSLP